MFQTKTVGAMTLITLIAGASPIAAQFTGTFGRVANEKFSGQVVVRNKLGPNPVDLPSINIGRMMDVLWDQQVTPKIKEEVAKMHNKSVGGGFGTYALTLAVGSKRQKYIGVDGRGFTLKYVVPGNSLTFKLRTPGPLPSETDPRFTADFDVEVLLDVETTTAKDLKILGGARVKILNAKLQPRNLSAVFVTAANNALRFFVGADFIGKVEKKINSTEVVQPVSQSIAKLTSDPNVVIDPTLVKSYPGTQNRGKLVFTSRQTLVLEVRKPKRIVVK